MATSKSVLVQLVWTSLICGQVLVSCKPQNSGPSASSSPSKADSADPPSGVSLGKTKGFEVKHGYSFNLANSPDGSPYSSGWAYLGGRAGPGPTYYADDTGYLSNELWSGPAVDIATGSLYTIAAALAFSSLWYTFSPFFSGRASTTPAKKPSASKGSKPSPSKTNTTATEEDSEEKGGQVTPSDKVTTKESVVPGKSSRRRRSLPKSQGAVVAQSDADLTRLASIVLNAIASGECLQKTICQLGTQIGASPKGRLAFSLVDTLLPTSVHTNQYFVTMKKALGGEHVCERFNCQYQTYA